MSTQLWLTAVAVLVALVALAIALTTRSRHARADVARPVPSAEPVRQPRGMQLAVVINPSKDGATDIREVVRQVCAEAAMPEPLFFETTVEDPGAGQAKAALDAGADVVVAAGGDGTVRAVAGALVGTGKPMGLVPVGTGNLLARNLDLPLTSTEEALAVVIGGRDRPIDVGWAQITEPADEPRSPEEREAGVAPGPARIDGVEAPLPGAAERPDESADAAAVEPNKEIFLVIAGLGFDAAMVADTDDELKSKVGWMAYFVAGVRHLNGRRMRVRVTLDDEPARSARLRSVLVGNCGRLPGGITLLPDAVLDDGELDVASIDARVGLAGWVQLLGEVVMQRFGVRTELPARMGRIDHARARRVQVRVAGGEQAQVDGDPLGRANELELWVEPRALVVRTA